MMPLRLVISMILALQAFVAWGSASRAVEAAETVAALTQQADRCGESCCCPPKACPCSAAPAPSEPTSLPPGLPPKPDRQDGHKIAPRPVSLTLVGVPNDGGADRATNFDAGTAPRGMAGRRVQQLQCVWLV